MIRAVVEICILIRFDCVNFWPVNQKFETDCIFASQAGVFGPFRSPQMGVASDSGFTNFIKMANLYKFYQNGKSSKTLKWWLYDVLSSTLKSSTALKLSIISSWTSCCIFFKNMTISQYLIIVFWTTYLLILSMSRVFVLSNFDINLSLNSGLMKNMVNPAYTTGTCMRN